MPSATKKSAKPATTITSEVASQVLAKSFSVKGRNEVRNEVYTSEDNREFHPLDPSFIRPIVVDSDKAKFDSLIKSGDSGVVEIDLNLDYDAAFQFIHGWLKANGKNRTPDAGHYGFLAEQFRKEFSPDATHWVLDSNGMVRNGGHSGHAVALAFFPPTIEYGIGGSPVVVKDGDTESTIPVDSELANDYLGESYETEDDETYDPSWGGYYFAHKGLVYASSPLVWKNSEEKRVGEYDDKGNYIVGTDSPEIRESQNLRITLRINADPTSCLKMDDIRREASFEDYLEMVAPIRAHMLKLPLIVRKSGLGTILRNYYLRVNHNLPTTYGFLSKGGRLNKQDVQQWYIAAIPQLLDCVEILKDTAGNIAQFPHFTATKEQTKGSVSLMHALVAMMISDDTGRRMIAKVLTSQYANLADAPVEFRKLREHIVRPKTAQGQASTDEIVQLLVFVGMGKTDAVDALTATYKVGDTEVVAWQCPDNRLSGWDKSNIDTLSDGTEEFTSVCIDAAKHIASILGDTSGVKNAEMKATRKGAGKRGRNK